MPDGVWPYEKIECGMQGVRDYIKYKKRGYSRISQMCALDLRNNRISQSDAERYRSMEGQRPKSLDAFLELIGMTEIEFDKTIDGMRVYPWGDE